MRNISLSIFLVLVSCGDNELPDGQTLRYFTPNPPLDSSRCASFYVGLRNDCEPTDLECDRLPSEGPCSLLCNPSELFEEYGIDGECAIIRCTNTYIELSLIYCQVE